ncbi:MAG: GerMN domain-containing protein [Patescibacteria group bacterium]|nr:GerMN domain-containing protein [Patescibacteria group bacterium]
MKTQKVILIIALAIILTAGVTIAVLRFSTPEDTWLCQNGQWIKHGNPDQPQPTTACGNGQTNTNGTVQTQKIIVSKPQANEEISNPYAIEGQAAGWYFEAVFPIKLLDASGKEIATAQAQAQGDWMTSSFVPFKATLNFSIDQDQAGTLVFMKDNPSGLPQNDEKFELPVKLKAGPTLGVNVYWGNTNKNPNAEDCRLVYPINRNVAKTKEVARAALEELLQGPTDAEKSQGYYTSINSNVKIQKLIIVNGTASVDFDEQLEAAVGGSCRVAAIRAQITQTLKQFSTVKNVIISINGRTEDILQP